MNDEAWVCEVFSEVVVSHATFVITVCDGAFPLAATGQLDGRKVTTFPADRGLLADMFPEVEVLYNTNFVVDGKFITSVGGALSYEPAFYLVEKLYGSRHAQLTAEGLVLSWNVNNIPHYIEELSVYCPIWKPLPCRWRRGLLALAS